MEFTRTGLEAGGFRGFRRVSELQAGGYREITTSPGVYVVLRESTDIPAFVTTCPVESHKGRPLAYSVQRLTSEWVRDCAVLNIGKADNLQERIGRYMKFGAGLPVAHRGGRAIWQLTDAKDLQVAWKLVGPPESPASVETSLLTDFHKKYGRLPFANMRW